jgi:hypothetical protein
MSVEDLADLFTPEFTSRSSTFESMLEDTEMDSQPCDHIGPRAAAAMDAPPVFREQVRLDIPRIPGSVLALSCAAGTIMTCS